MSREVDTFTQVVKQEAVPELVQLLPTDEAGNVIMPVLINVNGAKCVRRLGDADMEVLVRAVLKAGLKVEGISLTNHEITDAGVAQLCKLLNDDAAYNYYSVVASLELSGNSIGSKGCEQLAVALASNKKLKKLDLSWNPVGMRGGFRLAEMLVSNVGLEVRDAPRASHFTSARSRIAVRPCRSCASATWTSPPTRSSRSCRCCARTKASSNSTARIRASSRGRRTRPNTSRACSS